MVKAKRGMAEQSHVPKLHQLTNDYERLVEENKKLVDQKPKEQDSMLNEKALKEQLGDRYHEFGEIISKAKDDILRVAKMAQQAVPLVIKMQHPYTYSKWDSIHEPFNVVENILKDDESVYKALTPDLDFTVANGNTAYVSEVCIMPGDCGPANVEVSLGLDVAVRCIGATRRTSGLLSRRSRAASQESKGSRCQARLTRDTSASAASTTLEAET